MANDVGDLRRSAVVSIFAPGAVVDFRSEGAAISGVVSGLEEWDASFPQAGLVNPQRISEPRLERSLGVRGFRLPPVIDENWRDANGRPDSRRLVAVRFPHWLQCPSCDRIRKKWDSDPGSAARYCAVCTRRAPGRRKVFVVPVRFVMACPAGHLDDFPWDWWVGHKPECQKRGDLVLKSERPGLSGIFVSCPSCKQRRSLDGVFSLKTWEGRYQCTGRRPWLYTNDNGCNEVMRAVQRGASNLYFPVNNSALSIPSWSDGLQEALGIYWYDIVNTEAEDRAGFIRVLARNALAQVLAQLGLTPQELAQEVERRVAAIQAPGIDDIRGAEYRQFTLAQGYRREDDREFETRVSAVPASLTPWFSRIVRVVRLREVRAITGFTRIHPPGGEGVDDTAPISENPGPDWYPAIEVRGEGIFLEFSAEALRAWQSADVEARAQEVDRRHAKEWSDRGLDASRRRPVTARFLLIHTFAHALMRQLTLECGYSSASLHERIYVRDEPGKEMAGVLVYTGTTDADGTLGGLQRQGEAGRIAVTLPAAIRSMEWCSSDPLCIEGVLSGPGVLSNAACHACVLAPETACEEYNRFLDRALLVGAPGKPDVGYFRGLL